MILLLCSLAFRCELSIQIYHHTGLFEVGDIEYNENASMYVTFLILGARHGYYEENKVLTVLDNQTFYKILPLMVDKNISRADKIKILRDNSPTPLCESGNFIDEADIRCRFRMVKDGHLVVFPSTDRIGYFFIESGRFYCTKTQYKIMNGIIMMGISLLLFAIGVFFANPIRDCIQSRIENSLSNDEERDKLPSTLRFFYSLLNR